MELSGAAKDIENLIQKSIHNGELNEAEQVYFIKLIGHNYLGLKSIPEYKKKYGMSFPGVRNHRKVIDLFGKLLVIDND